MLPSNPHNFRDLGGIPTAAGLTLPGRIYRAGSPDELDADEWGAITSLGIRTLVDLRNPYEIPSVTSRPSSIAWVNRQVEDQADTAFMATWGDRLGSPAYYSEILERWPGLVSDAFSAIADAPPGAVLIHCSAGRDRTGMVVAMLLALVDADRAAILDDYVTGVREHNVRLRRGDLRERAVTDAELESAVRESRSELNEFLDSIDVGQYLLEAGNSSTELTAIRSRLLDD